MGSNIGISHSNMMFDTSEKVPIDNLNTNFVMFCNPNAIFYEYIAYQTDWLRYYTQELGLNMIVFNYRGYARSDMGSSKSCFQRIFGLINPSHIM